MASITSAIIRFDSGATRNIETLSAANVQISGKLNTLKYKYSQSTDKPVLLEHVLRVLLAVRQELENPDPVDVGKSPGLGLIGL